jgi:hypothetical protein
VRIGVADQVSKKFWAPGRETAPTTAPLEPERGIGDRTPGAPPANAPPAASVSGREVEDQEIALSFANGWWGPAPEGMPAGLLTKPRETRELWLWLAENDGATTDDLAKQYGRSDNATFKLLKRLEEDELIDSIGKAAPNRPVCWQVVRNAL